MNMQPTTTPKILLNDLPPALIEEITKYLDHPTIIELLPEPWYPPELAQEAEKKASFLFYLENHQKMRQKYPDLSYVDTALALGALWRKLGPAQYDWKVWAFRHEKPLKMMTVKEMKEECKQKGLRRYSALRRAELVEFCREARLRAR